MTDDNIVGNSWKDRLGFLKDRQSVVVEGK